MVREELGTDDLGQLVVRLRDRPPQDAHETEVIQVPEEHAAGLRVD